MWLPPGGFTVRSGSPITQGEERTGEDRPGRVPVSWRHCGTVDRPAPAPGTWHPGVRRSGRRSAEAGLLGPRPTDGLPHWSLPPQRPFECPRGRGTATEAGVPQWGSLVLEGGTIGLCTRLGEEGSKFRHMLGPALEVSGVIRDNGVCVGGHRVHMQSHTHSGEHTHVHTLT